MLNSIPFSADAAGKSSFDTSSGSTARQGGRLDRVTGRQGERQAKKQPGRDDAAECRDGQHQRHANHPDLGVQNQPTAIGDIPD
jgi:hypothetical protein